MSVALTIPRSWDMYQTAVAAPSTGFAGRPGIRRKEPNESQSSQLDSRG
jgi:hypothetical protein